MQAAMCSRCGKNVAVIFVTKSENGKSQLVVINSTLKKLMNITAAIIFTA